MKSLRVTLVGLVLAFGMSNIGHAAHRPYGMAGCDLWTWVIKDQGQWAQLGVWALRNAVLNVQTSAITSGTSNCVSDASKAYNDQEKQVFVATNLSELSKEASQGGGQHLNGLAQLLGCEDEEVFAKVSQENYQRIFGSSDPDAVLKNYEQEVRSNEVLSKSCLEVG